MPRSGATAHLLSNLQVLNPLNAYMFSGEFVRVNVAQGGKKKSMTESDSPSLTALGSQVPNL